MCGIAGVVTANPEDRLHSMLRSLEHRGRDDEGVWTAPAIDGVSACLGHRRLSIIDTSSAGHQPMISAEGRFVISLNGEIYNYRGLREQLRSKGHQFRTESDTEVLLAAWTEWGAECLPRLNGMFAFAVWDERERSLALVRDRVGIKPLYFAELNGAASQRQSGACGFLFASEPKAILASGLIKPELNIEALHQFLTFLWTPHPK